MGHGHLEPADGPAEAERLDKWLWAARFFKTRGLAAEAITGGKVQVGGARAKPAKTIRPGDEIRIRKGPYEFIVLVRGLSLQRGPASQAVKLYEETQESSVRRAALASERRALGEQRPAGAGRPTKRDRRQLDRITGR